MNKTSTKHLKIHKFPFKNVIGETAEYPATSELYPWKSFMGFSTFSGFKNDKYTSCIAFYAVLSVYRSGYADTAVKPRNSLGHRVQNVPENLAKTSLPSLHFKPDHALRCKNQSWIPRRTISWRKAFLPPQKENWAFSLTFSFHLCLLTMYF